MITDEAIKKYKLKLYQKGVILFPKSGASIYLEKRAILPMDAYIVSHLCIVVPNKDKINNQFLEWSRQYNSFDIKSNYISYHDNSNKEFKEVLITNYETEIIIPTQETINFTELETVLR